MPLLAINHHYFRKNGPGRGIYPTTPEQLKNKIKVLLKNGWKIGGQKDIYDFITEKKCSDKIAVITFDDGLKEQIKALTFLQNIGLNAVCFVPTKPVVSKSVLNVHKLQMIRAQLNDKKICALLKRKFDFAKAQFDEEKLAIQYRYDTIEAKKIKYFLNFILSEDERNNWISDVFIENFGSEIAASEKLYMDKNDILFLAKNNALGSHAHSHQPLAMLCAAQLNYELSFSLEYLSDLTKINEFGISYPYGGSTAVNEDVFKAADKIGYTYGLTMRRGTNELCNNSLDLLRIDTNDIEAYV